MSIFHKWTSWIAHQSKEVPIYFSHKTQNFSRTFNYTLRKLQKGAIDGTVFVVFLVFLKVYLKVQENFEFCGWNK